MKRIKKMRKENEKGKKGTEESVKKFRLFVIKVNIRAPPLQALTMN
jgi:hypothetical protein